MKCCRFGLALVIMALLAARGIAADPPPLLTAQGAVEKVDAATLTVKPRTPDGKVNMTWPVLRVNGRPDLSGIWQVEAEPRAPGGLFGLGESPEDRGAVGEGLGLDAAVGSGAEQVARGLGAAALHRAS